jgi:hypothetical protein
MDDVDPSFVRQRRRGSTERTWLEERDLDDAGGLQAPSLLPVGVLRPLMQLPDVHVVTSSGQCGCKVHDDRQDA